MTPQARQIIKEVSAACGVAPALITKPCRTRAVVYARIEIARRLRARGYSSPRIGTILGHDHTTILFYLGSLKRKPARPRWLKPTIKHLNCFCCNSRRDVGLPKSAVKERPKRIKSYLAPYAGADMREYNWKERRA